MTRTPNCQRPFPSPGPRAAWLGVVLALGVSCSLAGCYRPAPVAHAELRVPAQGDYSFDGSPVAPDQLHERVAAAKAAHGDLLVTIEPTPATDVARVRQAVAAVKQAQARVAFSGDPQALMAAPAASGVPAE